MRLIELILYTILLLHLCYYYFTLDCVSRLAIVFLMLVSSTSTYLLPPLLTGTDLVAEGAAGVGLVVEAVAVVEPGGETITDNLPQYKITIFISHLL